MTRPLRPTWACLPALTIVASGAFGQWYTDNELQRMKTRPLARAMLQVESEAARCSGVSLGRGYTDAVNVASDLGSAVTGDYSYRGYGNLVTGILDAISSQEDRILSRWGSKEHRPNHVWGHLRQQRRTTHQKGRRASPSARSLSPRPAE